MELNHLILPPLLTTTAVVSSSSSSLFRASKLDPDGGADSGSPAEVDEKANARVLGLISRPSFVLNRPPPVPLPRLPMLLPFPVVMGALLLEPPPFKERTRRRGFPVIGTPPLKEERSLEAACSTGGECERGAGVRRVRLEVSISIE